MHYDELENSEWLMTMRILRGGPCSFFFLPKLPRFPHVFLICLPFNKFARHVFVL